MKMTIVPLDQADSQQTALDERWVQLIRSDDAQAMRNHLDSLQSSEESERLLNGSIHVSRIPCISKTSDPSFACLQCSRSVILAMTCDSRNVIKVMLERGADITLTEPNGSNILHVLITLCDIDPSCEGALADFYRWLVLLVDLNTRTKLLHEENQEHLRPIELVAHNGHFLLFRAIMETPDVYLVRHEVRGCLTEQCFDITEYEGSRADRLDKSPLAFITFLKQSALADDSVDHMFSWGPMEQWYRLKSQTNLPFVILWLVLRLPLYTSYFVLTVSVGNFVTIDQPSGNVTTTGIPERRANCESFAPLAMTRDQLNPLMIYLLCHAFIIILFDIGEVFRIRFYKRPFAFQKTTIRRNVVVSFRFYWVTQHCVCWAFAIACAIFLDEKTATQQTYVYVGEILNLVAVIGTFCSILFFLQMVPAIGQYVLNIKRMLTDLLFFIILYIICLMPFTYYFFVFFNANSEQGCVVDFQDFWRSFYSSFLVMLNMINFREYDIRLGEILSLMHISYVFVVAILLVNFLIAVMSNTASELSKNIALIQKLERLHIFWLLEFRIRWIFPRYYRYMRRRVGIEKGDRTLLRNVTWNCNYRRE